MSAAPYVNVAFANGGILQQINNVNGKVGFVGTGVTSGNLNTIFTINSLADAETQGITLVDEPYAYRQLKEFYTELGGKDTVYLLLFADTVTMAQMLDSASVTKANKLFAQAGVTISYLGVFRNPPVGYNGGTNYMDSDVAAAVTAAKTFVENLNGQGKFLRVLIEGRVLIANESSSTIYAPNSADVDYAGVVLGGSLNDGSASVGLALGRKAKYGPHIKLGKVANGALSITNVFIGTKKLDEKTNLSTLHTNGYITFTTYPGKSGFYFGVDNMANTGDFKTLANGAVADTCARISLSVATNQLENEVDTNANGTMKEVDAKHLEDSIDLAVKSYMGDTISGFESQVDREENIINTATAPITLSILPKGYSTYITMKIGFTAGN